MQFVRFSVNILQLQKFLVLTKTQSKLLKNGVKRSWTLQKLPAFRFPFVEKSFHEAFWQIPLQRRFLAVCRCLELQMDRWVHVRLYIPVFRLSKNLVFKLVLIRLPELLAVGCVFAPHLRTRPNQSPALIDKCENSVQLSRVHSVMAQFSRQTF